MSELVSSMVIDCYRLLDPNTYAGVWNDSFLKRYLTALIKRQWGQNLIKFQELNFLVELS